MALHLVRGLPGSGKTTWVKKTFDCLHVEADMFFVKDGEYKWEGKSVRDAHDWCKKLTSDSIQTGADVVVSNTFTQLWELQPYLDMAKKYDTVVVVYKMTSQYGNVHNVPSEVVEKMATRWEDFEGEELV